MTTDLLGPAGSQAPSPPAGRTGLFVGILLALLAAAIAVAVRRWLKRRPPVTSGGLVQARAHAVVLASPRIQQTGNRAAWTLRLSAWTSYTALKAVGQRTIANAGSGELVELLSHQVTFDTGPSIDLSVNGSRIATVRLLLKLKVEVDALTATVRAGRLTGLHVGRCHFDASVSIEGRTLAGRQAELQLPFSMQLGSGIALSG